MKNKELEKLEFRYGDCEDHISVAVNPRHYDRRVSFAVELAFALRTRIPFDFEEKSEAKIGVLRSRDRERMLSIEMQIKPTGDKEAALKLLEKNGWDSLQDVAF